MSDPEDPLLEAQIERAMAPYVGMVPPKALAEMREFVSDFLATHPVAVRLMARLRPPPTVDVSGPLGDQEDPADTEPATERKTGTGGSQ
jgi:hypothetical protein